MRGKWMLAALGLLLGANARSGVAAEPNAAGSAAAYSDYATLCAHQETLTKAHPAHCVLEQIGRTRQGRNLWALRLARPGSVKPEDRPALLLVAGLDGEHLIGGETALRVAERLLKAPDDSEAARLLAEHTVYVIPRANPDAQETFFAKPQYEQLTAPTPMDDDRDGFPDEDRAEDLNGDGLITLMRVKDAEGTHLPDPVEPRLLREPDRAKGQRAIYKVYPEGLDTDADGEYNEDPFGGVDLNRNFPHGYAEHTPGAGTHAAVDGESRALIDFVIGHPRIAAVISYGRHNNLIETPNGEKKDATGRAPIELLKDDVAIYEAVGKRYRDIAKVKKAPKTEWAGAFFAWAYAQYGVPSFATSVWFRPESEEKKPTSEPAASQPDSRPASAPIVPVDQSRAVPGPDRAEDPDYIGTRIGVGHPASAPTASPSVPGSLGPSIPSDDKPADEEAAAWLKYSDKDRGGDGFVPWTSFKHPTLGEVEIGGFKPFFRSNPPVDQIDALAEREFQFAVELLGKLPKLAIEVLSVEAAGESVFEIEIALVNNGYFPTGLAIAVENRRVGPIVARLDVAPERLLGGPRQEQVWSIPGSGGVHKIRWAVVGAKGSSVTVKASSTKYGDLSRTIELNPTPEAHP